VTATPAPSEGRPDALVLGAGAVGLLTALSLQDRGLSVALIDRQPPGRAASFGNAGVLSPGSIHPLARPGLWRQLPRMIAGREPGLRAPWRHLPAHARWGLAMLRRYASLEAIAASRDGLAALTRDSAQRHRTLLERAGAGDLWSMPGFLKLFSTEAEAAAGRAEAAEYERRQIRHRLLDVTDLAELEPHLQGYAGALWTTEAGAVADPGAACEAYARLFLDGGGRIETAAVRCLVPGRRGVAVETDAGRLSAPVTVVALGAWSARALAPLGYRIPLVAERGYHRHFAPVEGRPLGRPVHDVGGGYVVAPQRRGLRLTSGTELSPIDAPPTPVQLAKAEARARGRLPLGERVGEPWLGGRPTLPDSLPMIGPAPGHDGLWFAFGHQHVGFATSAVTGALVAALATGDAPPIGPAPYRPGRMAVGPVTAP